uniref:glutaredoxin family protein n=1 Tax=Cellvibrio fontiphilus TaxID=1815559 RepID=UPI002B4BB2F0|nr:glutaredoxin family protein [Cellvibrio fontiphilus]
MKAIYLYSTPGCHLCELAREIVDPLLGNYVVTLEEIDIAQSDELIERYGVKIPVLKSPHHLEELCWPFDTHQAAAFLERVTV